VGKKLRLDHLALECRDIPRMVQFYQRYAEMEVIHDRHEQGVRVTWIRHRQDRSGLILILIHRPKTTEVKRETLNHLGFHAASRSDVDLLSKLADSEGCLVEPAKEGGMIMGYYCTVRDPDGNLVEFSFGQAKAPCDEK
jgi:catechol 2,3-dioxygenase-like lactoylglutathione lyase family enzyme